jgi:DME family drug/metabolite transporter
MPFATLCPGADLLAHAPASGRIVTGAELQPPATRSPAPGVASGRLASGYLQGVLLVALAGVCWSTGGLLVRLVEAADAWQIIFYRSLSLALSLLLIVAIRHRGRIAHAFAKAGWTGVIAGACLSGGFIGYVLSLYHTSVANAVFMLATAPFFSAILGRWFLGERVLRATWLAMALAMLGVAVMVEGSFVVGTIAGSLLALGASLSFAVYNVLLRRGRANDMMPCVVVAGLIAALIAAPVVAAGSADAGPDGAFVLSAHDLTLCLTMGALQVGMGLTLFTLGARHVSAVELALLAMTEPVLAPLWVWFGVGEVPSAFTLAGGAIVISAIGCQALSGARRRPTPPMV